MLDLTFHVLLLGTLLWISASACSKLSAERPIFEEFALPGALRLLVLLYPIAPLLLLVGFLVGAPGLAALLAFACLVPGLLVAYRTGKRLETSGTDRTKPAAAATALAMTGALAGLIYVVVVAGMQLAIGQLHSVV